MARSKTPSVGQFVELRQDFAGTDIWIPMLVTDVHDDDVISGVAFTAFPNRLGWGNRGAQPYDFVKKGRKNRNWRFTKVGGTPAEGTNEPEPEPETKQDEGETQSAEAASDGGEQPTDALANANQEQSQSPFSPDE